MNQSAQIEPLARAIAVALSEVLANASHQPLSSGLCDADEIAEYLKVTRRQVTERYASLPGFPQAIRLPSEDGGKGRPRWKSEEVLKWIERHQERRAA